MRRIRTVLAAISLAAALSPANAALHGIRWRAVENTIMPGVDPEWDAFVASYNPYTFDMVLLGDVGDRVTGVDMGDASMAPGPNRLGTNGRVFNHSAGGDLRTPNFENVDGFKGLRYDTFVALGADAPGPEIQFTGLADLNANGTSDQILRAPWITTDDATLVAGPSGFGEVRLMRITVGYQPGFDPYLDGGVLGSIGVSGSGSSDYWQQSWLDVQLFGGDTERLVIGYAFVLFPTPGGAALAGLAGLLGLRRRR